jgi:hypothetical protein
VRTGHRLIAGGGSLRFVHAVNSRERMDRFLADPRLNAFEADVSWGTVRGGPGAPRPIMAHPPMKESDLSFEDWLDASLGGERVVKVDLKDQRSNRAVLDILAGRDLPLDRFLVNANFTPGLGGGAPLFAIADAVEWRERFGEVVISIGMTVGPGQEPYGREEIDALLAAADAVGEPATVCLDVHRVESELGVLEWLVGRHVTLWNQHPADAALYRRYRGLLPTAFIDLFDAAGDPIVD